MSGSVEISWATLACGAPLITLELNGGDRPYRTWISLTELRDLAIAANAALASIPHAAPSEDTTP